MRDRVQTIVTTTAMTAPPSGEPDSRDEAFDALVSLGYKPAEIKRLLGNLETDDLSAENIIRQALKQAVN
jgi:Holliday junction resolvasome RuvABC DNA-binding subunit